MKVAIVFSRDERHLVPGLVCSAFERHFSPTAWVAAVGFMASSLLAYKCVSNLMCLARISDMVAWKTDIDKHGFQRVIIGDDYIPPQDNCIQLFMLPSKPVGVMYDATYAASTESAAHADCSVLELAPTSLLGTNIHLTNIGFNSFRGC